LLLRFEHFQRRHYGMKLMAYTLINLRRLCSAYNLQPVNDEECVVHHVKKRGTDTMHVEVRVFGRLSIGGQRDHWNTVVSVP